MCLLRALNLKCVFSIFISGHAQPFVYLLYCTPNQNDDFLKMNLNKKLFPVLRGNTETISDLGQILKEIHFVIFTDVGYFWIMKGSSFSSHRVSLMFGFSPMFDEI